MLKYTAIGFAALLLGLCSMDGFALTGSEIIKKSEDAVRGSTQIAKYRITIKTKHWERTMVMKSWDSRKDKKGFSEVIAPEKDAGNRFLLINKTMWHFVPKLQKEYKISPSMMLQSWMGSDFSNDDIVKESSMVDDYTHSLEGKETVSGEECYKVVLTPKAEAAVVWGKIVYFARIKDCLPVREEYYNEKSVLKKFMDFSEFKLMHDRVIPTVFKMQTVGKKGNYTLLEIESIRFNVEIPAKIFTIQNLQRR